MITSVARMEIILMIMFRDGDDGDDNDDSTDETDAHDGTHDGRLRPPFCCRQVG